MKGNQQIIDVLNDVLTAELTAVNQYFLHAKMLKNWGYARLAQHVRAESIDEMKHADELIERVLYLEGLPNLQRLGKLNIGETAIEQLKNDLAMEYDAVKRFNDGILLCRDLGDNGSEDLLKKMLVSEEEHVDWLETQLELVKQIGEANYLSQQLHSLAPCRWRGRPRLLRVAARAVSSLGRDDRAG
jgi:bacterioferritin